MECGKPSQKEEEEHMSSFWQDKIAELERYLPPLTRREDFDDFWARTRAQAAELAGRLAKAGQDAMRPYSLETVLPQILDQYNRLIPLGVPMREPVSV